MSALPSPLVSFRYRMSGALVTIRPPFQGMKPLTARTWSAKMLCLIDFAVAVGVFEQSDAGSGRFVRAGIVGIVHHLGDIDFPVLIEHHFYGAHYLRFVRK